MKCETCKMKRVCNELERMGKVPKHENCCCYSPEKPTTNYDLLCAKSVEEMAEWIGKVTAGGYGMCAPGHYDCSGKESCAPCWLDWLKQEVTEE